MDKLTETVKKFLDDGRMFTGYDVTVETRRREKMHLRHEDVRQDVHQITALTDALEFGHDTLSQGVVMWKKTQKDMPTGGWAFVYHPSYLDPQSYQPITVPNAVAQASPQNSISAVAVSDSGGQQTDGTFATDYRNRLLVPTKFLKEIGLNPADEIFVCTNTVTNSIILFKDQEGFKVFSTCPSQKVERHGDIRLSAKTIGAAGITSSNFLIENTEQKLPNNEPLKVVEIKAA